MKSVVNNILAGVPVRKALMEDAIGDKYYYVARWLDNTVLVGMDHKAKDDDEILDVLVNGLSYDPSYTLVPAEQADDAFETDDFVVGGDKHLALYVGKDWISFKPLLTSDSLKYYMTNVPYVTKHGVAH